MRVWGNSKGGGGYLVFVFDEFDEPESGGGCGD